MTCSTTSAICYFHFLLSSVAMQDFPSCAGHGAGFFYIPQFSLQTLTYNFTNMRPFLLTFFITSKAKLFSKAMLIIMNSKCDLSQILTTPQKENSSSTIFISASRLATASSSCFKSRKIARNRSQDVYLLPRGGSILINECCSIMC